MCSFSGSDLDRLQPRQSGTDALDLAATLHVFLERFLDGHAEAREGVVGLADLQLGTLVRCQQTVEGGQRQPRFNAARSRDTGEASPMRRLGNARSIALLRSARTPTHGA